MADISMCQNKECPSKETCYRFTAVVSQYGQSYAKFSQDENGYCEGFTHNGKESEERTQIQDRGA